MNELYAYPMNDYRYFLAHHGIKGQKWGQRNADWYPIAAWKEHLSRVGGNENDGQGFKARMKIRGQGLVNDVKDIGRDFKKAKGVVGKASAIAGHTRGETHSVNRMVTQKRLADASKTRLGKAYHNTKAENARYDAEYHEIKRGQSVKRRIGEMVIPVTLLSKPTQSMTGRKSTAGLEYLIAATTSGWGNIGLDAAYYAMSKNRKASGKKTLTEAHAENYGKKAKESYDTRQEKESNKLR